MRSIRTRAQSRRFLPPALALLLAGAGCATTPSFPERISDATDLFRSPSSEEQPRVSAASLESGIAARRGRIAEFRFLRDYGKQHGLRIFAAGGTAVGYGSYVKQHLENEELKRRGKPPKYFESRFEYDYYDVYRSTQDADIVIDLGEGASPAAHEEAARELEAVMNARFGHLQGAKSVWEVRFLRVDRGQRGNPSHKDALLGWDFQNQNTDSYSTGLVELTDPPAGESVVRDVKEWSDDPVNASRARSFLEDLAEGKIRFYLESNHARTLRASQGMNPEILSVIRFYAKAFQYGAAISPTEEEKLARIIRAFDPDAASVDGYAAKQIRGNGLKLYWHAMDVDRASRELERVGLKRKLIRYGERTDRGGKPSEQLSVWLAREPLPSLPLGSGRPLSEADTYRNYRPSFKTAENIGIEIVAHETDQFLAYENITRAASGYPNVFQSIGGQTGQTAAYGNGWYTKIGREGARGTGLTVRARVDPNAIEGVDFFVVHNIVVFRNRDALRVIDESLVMTPLEYFRLLFSQEGVDQSDRGLFEKLSRKIGAKLGRLSESEKAQINTEFLGKIDPTDQARIRAWLVQPISQSFPDFAIRCIERRLGRNCHVDLLSQPHWLRNSEFLAEVVRRGKADQEAAQYFLSDSHWSNHPEWVEKLLERGNADREIAQYVLPQAHWSNHPEWVEKLLERGTADREIARYVLSQAHWSNRAEWVEKLLERGTADREIAGSVLTKPHGSNHPEWVETLLHRGKANGPLAEALSKPHWRHRTDWVDRLVNANPSPSPLIAIYVLSKEYSTDHPEWLGTLIAKEIPDYHIVQLLNQYLFWWTHPVVLALSADVLDPAKKVATLRDAIRDGSFATEVRKFHEAKAREQRSACPNLLKGG